MPSIRIRRNTSYSSLNEDSQPPLLSPRSLTSIFNPPTPTGTTSRPPRDRPSLPVIKSGEEVPYFRPRSNTLGRVQSHVLRDSRSSLHGRDIESAVATPATAPYQFLESPQIDGIPYQEHSKQVTGPTYERDWDDHHHDDVVEHLDAIGACSRTYTIASANRREDPQVSMVSMLTNAANSILMCVTMFNALDFANPKPYQTTKPPLFSKAGDRPACKAAGAGRCSLST